MKFGGAFLTILALLGGIAIAFAANCCPTTGTANCGCANATVCTWGFTHGFNGKPTCTHALETQGSRWRNNNDPTRYWLCDGGKATNVICATSSLYQESGVGTGECVSICQWVWKPPCDPPTKDVTAPVCPSGGGCNCGCGCNGGSNCQNRK